MGSESDHLIAARADDQKKKMLSGGSVLLSFFGLFFGWSCYLISDDHTGEIPPVKKEGPERSSGSSKEGNLVRMKCSRQ